MEGNKRYNILIVDDEKEYQQVLSLILEDIGYSVFAASNGKEALEVLNSNEIDIVITDLRMPVMDGNQLISQISKMGMKVDIIVMTAYASIESAVDTMKYGAADYFVKSNNIEELVLKVKRFAEMREISKENLILKENQKSDESFLESNNPTFQKLLSMCRMAADTNINVLLLGESGVGKEIIANYIYKNSSRSSEPFVAVNCQALPFGVIESELFGHEKGAFTGAVGSRMGKFELANHGTIFLDEIGDLPIETQGKLLRVLENRKIERIGSNKEIKLDVRFISATNKNLSDLVKENKFREDLLYRINTLTLEIPPLRYRKEDILDLSKFFINKICLEQKKVITSWEPEVEKFLLEYDYPGNVRELKNILERMIALNSGEVLTLDNYPCQCPCDSDRKEFKLTGALRDARDEFEKTYIEEALLANGYNVSRTAEFLKISSRQLWNKISKYNIEVNKSE